MKLNSVNALVVGGLSSLVMLAGCGQPLAEDGQNPRSSGSVALSNDDALIYAADTDRNVVAVFDARSKQQLYAVKVGERPFRLAVGADDTLYVGNRGSRSVSVIRKGDQVESAQLPTDVDPVGLALAADGKTLYVVCATASDSTDSGTLTAVDTATLQPKWQLQVGNEPRGIALVDHGARAIISLYREGDLVEVDLVKASVLQHGTTLYSRANQGALSGAAAATFHPRAMSDVIAAPSGNRVFVTTLWDRESSIGQLPNPSTGYYGSGGPCSAGAVASAGIVTVETGVAQQGLSSLEVKVDDLSGSACSFYGANGGAPDYPSSSLAVSPFAPSGAARLQGPTVGVVDWSGRWLFVVNRESHNVSVLSADRRVAHQETPEYSSGYVSYSGESQSVHSVVDVGEGPDGIALTRDGSAAYVYSQFDHRLQKLGRNGASSTIVKVEDIGAPVGGQTADTQLEAGRRLFFNAVDPRLSSAAATVACSSCHLEGRDDAHVWNFPDGPRQTPMLAGRGTLETKPYHWSGEFQDLNAFMNHTISSRMGGTGLDAQQTNQLDAYIGSLPAPENPLRGEGLTDAQARGSQVFAQAGCDSCHSGQWLTNNQNRQVGTLVLTGPNPDNGAVADGGGFNVPSLRGLARSAPYLHDGSASTLKGRLLANPGDLHGVTSTLRDEQLDDLVAYLNTL